MRQRVQWLSAAIVGVGVLTLTSRRWSAPLLASALGMGLFVGVAFGPAADRLDALGSQVIAVHDGSPATTETAATADAGSEAGSAAGGGDGSSGSGPGSVPTDTTPTSYAPAPEPAATTPVEEEPAPVDDTGTDDTTDETDPGTDAEDPSGGLTLAGTVVHVNPAAESYALAVRGELYGVHADKLPEPGDQVEAPLRELANGTYAEDGKRIESGATESATLNGFVTYVGDDDLPGYVISARGVSIMVSVPGSDSPELPKLGEFVSVDSAIDEPPESASRRLRRAAEPGEVPVSDCARDEPVEEAEPRARLVEKRIEPTGDEFTYFDLAATVQAICPESGKLLISADDIRQAGVDLVLTVPKGIDLSVLEVDQPVLATAELDEDGTLSLAGIASDDGADGADDADQLQGDFAN